MGGCPASVGAREGILSGWLAESKIAARDAGTQLVPPWLGASLLAGWHLS